MPSGWMNRILAWKRLSAGPRDDCPQLCQQHSLGGLRSVPAALGIQRRRPGGCPRPVPPQPTPRLGSESKDWTRRCSQPALIRSASKTEEKQATVRCVAEIAAVDSGGSTWEESGQHTLGLSRPRAKASRTIIYHFCGFMSSRLCLGS